MMMEIKMLFRIEDTENTEGFHRQYELPEEELPRMRLSELDEYIAGEVRKEINNSNDRKLLSYSKSLGVCLLKYNNYTDNELHISHITPNQLFYYDCKKEQSKVIWYDIHYGMQDYEFKHSNRKIVLCNFSLDVSDNAQVNYYLNRFTGVGKKKYASPEKDKEVVLMQSPNDLVISQYTDSVYLLYALVYKYGMSEYIFRNLYHKIATLDEFRFDYCPETEREALLNIVSYLYYRGYTERYISNRVFMDS